MANGQDSLDFFARYKDWVVARSLNVSQSTDPKEVAAFIVSVRNEVDNRAFEVLGVNTKLLDSYSQTLTKGLAKGNHAEIIKAYKLIGSKETEQSVSDATANREEIKPFAKAYLFKAAMQNLGINFYVPITDKAFAGKGKQSKGTTAVPFQSEGISFMVRYKDWVAIKKMSIDEKTKPEEISAHLSSVRIAADRKEPEILGVNTETIAIYANSVTANLRKSAANLEKIIAALSSQEGKAAIQQACGSDKSLESAAQTYLFSTMMQSLKFDFEVNPQTLMDMFPGLKIPKPKGRMPGQKKKKQ